jgi:hypothetical protein
MGQPARLLLQCGQAYPKSGIATDMSEQLERQETFQQEQSRDQRDTEKTSLEDFQACTQKL